MDKQSNRDIEFRIFNDAENRLLRYFSNGGWEIYDGVEVDPSEITIQDIALSVALDSRVNRTIIWNIWQKLPSLNKALNNIPNRSDLRSEQIPWIELSVLFDRFCKIDHVAEAVTTKILHKKRSYLIPICDSIVSKYFQPQLLDVWYSGNSKFGGAKFLVKYLEVFRNLLVNQNNEISQLHQFVTDKGWRLSPIRILEVLIWIENQPRGEYK